jgi:hypothetical protein
LRRRGVKNFAAADKKNVCSKNSEGNDVAHVFLSKNQLKQ